MERDSLAEEQNSPRDPVADSGGFNDGADPDDGLVDVRGKTLPELMAAAGGASSPVGRSIERLQEDLKGSGAVLSAFSSFLDEEGDRPAEKASA